MASLIVGTAKGITVSTWIVTLEGGTPIGVDQGTLSRMALDRQITPDSVVKDEESQTEYRAGSIPGLFSPKSWVVAFVLSVLLGYLGIDRFYTGRVGLGILKLLTAGGGSIWWIIDAILFGTRSGRDRQGRRIA